jgi:hypothetical protein
VRRAPDADVRDADGAIAALDAPERAYLDFFSQDAYIMTRPAGSTANGEESVANQVGKRYQCTKCNSEMIVTKGGDGALSCCGQPMQQK